MVAMSILRVLAALAVIGLWHQHAWCQAIPPDAYTTAPRHKVVFDPKEGITLKNKDDRGKEGLFATVRFTVVGNTNADWAPAAGKPLRYWAFALDEDGRIVICVEVDLEAGKLARTYEVVFAPER